MMIFRRALTVAFVAAMILVAVAANAQRGQGDPYSGYVYPAGGCQGSTFQATVGGQYLRGVTGAYINGEGVEATLVEYVRPLSNKDRGEIGRHLRVVMRQRMDKRLIAQGVDPEEIAKKRAQREKQSGKKDEELPELRDHPWTRGLYEMNLEELNRLREKLFDPKKQDNAQIAEWAILEITISPDAAPGERELRLVTNRGLTNPVRFRVSMMAEVCEQEPNSSLQQAPAAVAVPVVLNGQIMPGDVDIFRLQAQKGQDLVFSAEARSLVPYLADAVPGWFQATLTLFDSHGDELAYVDDYRFNPDPVLLYQVPESGEYLLEVRDAIYRGREDFVYRVSVGEQPFITQMFPLGGLEGSQTTAQIAGWNLPCTEVELDTDPGGPKIRRTRWCWDEGLSNAVAYAIGTAPECEETTSNDTIADAQPIEVPQVVNGRIERPGDVDVFTFEAQAGEEIVAEVHARRLNSPLDSFLDLLGPDGERVATNDDHEDPGAGLVTHHADSYLRARLERPGTYTLHLSDPRGQGGEAYAYRLHVRVPEPDFALRVTPSSLSFAPGGNVPITAHVVRYDGFDGAVDIELSDAPKGFVITGGRIPPGRDRIRMTITAGHQKTPEPLELNLVGQALINGEVVTRMAVPAEDMMQAFFYTHLVPSRMLCATVGGRVRAGHAMGAGRNQPLTLVKGDTTAVELNVPKTPMLERMRFELSDPPAGISLKEVTDTTDGIALMIETDAEIVDVGYSDNLIIEVILEGETKREDGTVRQWSVPIGVLPAIPVQIASH